MKKLDIGSIVRVVGDETGKLLSVHCIGASEYQCIDGEGGRQWFTRDLLELVEDEPDTGDTEADQFTGSDLGAEMAAAEGGMVECQDCNRLKHVINDDDSELNYEVGVCTWSTQFKARNFPRRCSDFEPIPRTALRVPGEGA